MAGEERAVSGISRRERSRKEMQNAIFCRLLSVEILLKTTPQNEKCYLTG